jgi:hypothetical protein
MFLIGRKQSYAESAVILNTHPKTVERTILERCAKTASVSGVIQIVVFFAKFSKLTIFAGLTFCI